MRYDLHLRKDMINKIQNVVSDIKQWNQETSADADEIKKMSEFVGFFQHCSIPDRPFTIGGADGSGEFPVATYGDSYIYLVNALARLYTAAQDGLKELEASDSRLSELLWLPEDAEVRDKRYEDFFANLAGMPLLDLCRESDYLSLRQDVTGTICTPEELVNLIVKPPAHDANNVRIHLMTAAEVCCIIKILKSGFTPTYLLADTTLTLPLIRQRGCLFFELVKRYCCKFARQSGVAFFAISKSHTIPHMEQLEEMINNLGGQEHWYLRIPTVEEDGFRPDFLGARGVPPIGGVTYIFRLHRNVPPFRLDMDKFYWKENIWSKDKDVMAQRERQIFRDLDFASHDQRSYGYPYPIKASHDFVSLTQAERVALRKQIIDAAERVGLKRRNFIDSSMLTGHRLGGDYGKVN
jgi:hypothetical protein